MTFKNLSITIILAFSAVSVFGQYSQLKDTSKNEYPYVLPIMGKKVHEKGFDIPYPVGIMLNNFYAKQDVNIDEISVGFKDGLLPEIPLTDITEIMDFKTVSSQALSINVRPDVWILPFLNVYGIFGKAWSTTLVEISAPINLKAEANLEGVSYGFGTTGAFGLGKIFVVLDGNWVWTDMSNFEKPVRSSVFSFRFGKTFKLKKPDKNFAFWIGGMRIKLDNITEGSIILKDVLPAETWDKRDELVDNYYQWYDGLKPLDPKKVLADKVLTPIVEKLSEADDNGTVTYKLDKSPKQEWNMIIGGQYQINKAWQIRAEEGVIGNRKSALL